MRPAYAPPGSGYLSPGGEWVGFRSFPWGTVSPRGYDVDGPLRQQDAVSAV
jgi:hypothetical protein